MKEISITIKQIGKDSVEEQLTVFNTVFNTHALEQNWIHKHYENPLKRSDNVFGAFDGDKLVGINAFMPMQYVYGGRKINAVQSCESAVDQDYRGQGIFTKIIKAAEQYYAENGYDILVGYPNKNSYPGLIKMGWTRIANQKLMIIPCRFDRMVHNHFHLPALKILNLPSCILFSKIKWNARKCDNGILEEETIAGYAKLPDPAQNVISLFKPFEILQWKLGKEDCLLLSVNCQEQVIAKFIVKFENTSSLKKASILSAIHCSGNRDIYIGAYSMLLLHLRNTVDAITALAPRTLEGFEVYKRIGLRAKGNLPFIIRPLSQNEDILKLLNNPRLWSPELLESDTIISLSS